MASSNIFNVVDTTISDIHAAYRSGDLSARQLVQMYLDRIEASGFRVDGPRIKFGKVQRLSLVFSALLRTL